ncbi:MAG: hypothetical protein K2H96_04510 [Muribaculaceae bacterium]|nr:hypothetical protein [Muribaculaceae bacterium]
MKLPYSKILLASALTFPILAFAGNIPQYKVSKGTAKYAEFSDGTELPFKWSSYTTILYPSAYEALNAYSAPGYPIGFDFRFGGRVFNQFVVSSAGNVYLGNGTVNYRGDAFIINMSPILHGLKKASVSYRVSGDEGNQVLEIQYKDAILNETSKYPGKYSLQIRMFESDGRIEMALKELNTVVEEYFGFDVSLSGYDTADRLAITGEGLDKPFTVFTGRGMDILDPSTYLHWDSDDYDMDYMPVFVFSPDNNREAPKVSPADLEVVQKENSIIISCRKGEDADATVVLVSDQPFTDADLPVDGETFRAGKNTEGEWYTKLGSSIALYYGDDENIELEYEGIESGKDYYICAISANGYPAYNRENRAEQVLISSQSAPESLRVAQNGPGAFTLTCKADYPVIIATTTEGRKEYGAGYVGVFGTPTAGVSAGDELPDGGRVIYVGEEADGLTVEAPPNTLTYFRAWTVDGDRVSATYIDATGISAISFPYEPAVEDYPLDFPLWGWQHSDIGQFVAVKRAYGNDRALCATSIEDNEYRLTTPYFTSDRDMTLSFEMAMETEKEAAVGEEGQVMMQGYEPGQFGETGYFRVSSGTGLLKEIKEYNGTMKGSISGGNEDGSSTFEPVEVAVPATGKSQSVSFAFSTPKKSRLYLRNLRMEQTGEPIQTGVSEISMENPLGTDLSGAVIYNVAGVRIKAKSFSDLPAGLYIINGNKVMKK